MSEAKSRRPSFSLRLQPYEGSLLAEVVQFLNSLDRAEANRRVENVLVMALLAQARLYDAEYSGEERRRCCIEACDALEKHASALRQLVGVEAPMSWAGERRYEATAMTNGGVVLEGTAQASVAEEIADDEGPGLPPPKAKREGKARPADVDALFGG